MATIQDYLVWRGDLSFRTDPLNEVDNYILAKVGCPDYTGIVPAGGETVLLRDAVQTFFKQKRNEDVSFGALASSMIAPVLRKLTATQRFGEVGLSGEVRTVSQVAQRVSEAVRLGFKTIIVPAPSLEDAKKAAGKEAEIIGVSNVREAVDRVI